MIEDFAKDYLHGQLSSIRQALIWKLEAAGGSHHADLSDTHCPGGDVVRNPDLVEVRP